MISSPQRKLYEVFAQGILNHFKRISIPGKYIIEYSNVTISIIAYDKTIITKIPLKVIMNVSSSIEAMQRTRFEIVQELTMAIVKVGENRNGEDNKKIGGKKNKRRRKKRKV